MDWNRWREEEDVRQRELKAVEELRAYLGIKPRTRARFLFDRVALAIFLAAGVVAATIGIPWVAAQYWNNPELRQIAWECIKTLPPFFGVFIVVLLAAIVGFEVTRKNKK